ncbi:MAG: hypothetical protein P8013_13005 [Candidatus Sulfobium sp.]
MRDKWKAPGDFSIKTDPLKYRDALRRADRAYGQIGLMKEKAGHFDKERMMRFKRLEESVFHDPKGAEKYLKDFR